MCFSNGCDLYVLCHENNSERHNKKVVIYRVDVGMDTTVEKNLNYARASTIQKLPSVMRLQVTSALEFDGQASKDTAIVVH